MGMSLVCVWYGCVCVACVLYRTEMIKHSDAERWIMCTVSACDDCWYVYEANKEKKTKKRIAWSKCAPDVDAGMLHSALLCSALLCYAVHHVLLLLPARCPISNISTDVIAIGSSVVDDDWMLYLLFCVHHHHQTLTELLRCPGRVLVHSNFRNIDASQCACSTARYLVCDTLRKMLRAILLQNWI